MVCRFGFSILLLTSNSEQTRTVGQNLLLWVEIAFRIGLLRSTFSLWDSAIQDFAQIFSVWHQLVFRMQYSNPTLQTGINIGCMLIGGGWPAQSHGPKGLFLSGMTMNFYHVFEWNAFLLI